MFDKHLRPVIDPYLKRLCVGLINRNISPNAITIIGFIFGCFCFIALYFNVYPIALLLLGLNRLADGLDGVLARQLDLHDKPGQSDFGGYLDIVLDFIFYAGFIFFFGLGQPEYALPAAFLLFSFMGTASSFLSFAIIAEKNKISLESNHGHKKLFDHLGGLTEGSETILTFILICCLPHYFMEIAIVFGTLCWITTATRILTTFKTLNAVKVKN